MTFSFIDVKVPGDTSQNNEPQMLTNAYQSTNQPALLEQATPEIYDIISKELDRVKDFDVDTIIEQRSKYINQQNLNEGGGHVVLAAVGAAVAHHLGHSPVHGAAIGATLPIAARATALGAVGAGLATYGAGKGVHHIIKKGVEHFHKKVTIPYHKKQADHHEKMRDHHANHDEQDDDDHSYKAELHHDAYEKHTAAMKDHSKSSEAKAATAKVHAKNYKYDQGDHAKLMGRNESFNEGLKGDQHEIDVAAPKGKIDSKDFEMLRMKKKKKEEDMVAMKKKKKSMYAGYEPQGELVDENILKDAGKKIMNFIKKPIIEPTVTEKEYKKRVDDKTTNQLVEPGTQKNSYDPEGETIEEADKKGKGSGTKDACYHKVKSRYSVWPSAYASGALVKCRKVGAANWGNSSKKEDFSDWKSEFIWEDGDSLKKLTEEDELTKLRNAIKTGKMDGQVLTDKQIEGLKAAITQGGNKLEEDWQKTNRQDKTDGMSQKAVNAYKRENPGSKLKTAVTKKPSSLKRGSKDAKRRKSFCSRMKGMKKRLTSAKTARDPDSRINKALRRWNC